MRLSALAVSGLVAVLACGGGGGGGTGPTGGGGGGGGGGGTLVHAARVTATTGLTFDPQTVSIAAKDTIYFTFQSVQHNVVFDTQGNPGNIASTHDATVKEVFPTAGTYDYHCSIHPQMMGTITVTP